MTPYVTALVKKQHPTARTRPSTACVCVCECVCVSCKTAMKSQCQVIFCPSLLLYWNNRRRYVCVSVYLCVCFGLATTLTLCVLDFSLPPPSPRSAVAMATHQEAPSCVCACDRNFITAHKRWLCVFLCLRTFSS